MHVYSETVFSFIEKARLILIEIIKNDCLLDFKRSRFTYASYTWPISVHVFEKKAYTLAYFDPKDLGIHLSEALCSCAKDSVLRDILRHEFMHYLCFIKYDDQIKAHGPEFKSLCQSYGLSSDVSKASMNLNQAIQSKTGELQTEKILAKVERLFLLAESSNQYESQLAISKANALLKKHHLNFDKESREQIRYYTDTVFTSKQKNMKFYLLANILREFMLETIAISSKGYNRLEVCGKKEDVLLAHYLVPVLERECERLWLKAKLQNPLLHGRKDKNSFLHGLQVAYCQSIRQKNDSSFNAQQNKQLILANKERTQFFNRIYKTGHSTRGISLNHDAYASGIKASSSLNVNAALKNKNSSPLKQLGYE